ESAERISTRCSPKRNRLQVKSEIGESIRREKWTVLLAGDGGSRAVMPDASGSGTGCSSVGPGGRRALQPPAQPASGLHRDLPGRGRGASGVGHPVAEKAAQDAVGIPFSEREAVHQRRPGGVVLPAGGTATQKDGVSETGRPAVSIGIFARQDQAGE